MPGPGIGVLFLMLLIVGVIGGEILARLLPRWGYLAGARVVRIIMLIGSAAYAGALLAVSLTSKERVLARGEILRFCGVYLDCHLGVSVQGVERLPAVGSRRAQGMFYVLRLRVSSDAKRATLHLGRPDIRVIDGHGRTYGRAVEAERSLTQASGDSLSLVGRIAAGESHDVRVVFDLPSDIREPRLLVKDVAGVDRMLEALLIGDDDSIFHKPTTLALR
jgi:hypothetical protein